jgi:hypothetical protein
MTMEVEPRVELTEIAERVRARIQAENLIYPNVAERFDMACRFRHAGRRVSWSTNGKLFLVEVERAGGIVFAAGFPDDLIMGAREPIGEVRGIAVFESEGLPSPKRWLAEPRHQDLLAAVGPMPNEQLLVTANGVTLIAVPHGLNADWGRLEQLIEFVDALPLEEGCEMAFDMHKVPSELRPLAPLIPEWSIGDDLRRSEQVERASTTELTTMVQAVTPVLQKIDDLIAAQDEALSDEALQLGRLAKATLEAQQELERRKDRPASA